MALINCRECGREISDAAPACPGCGCPKVSGKTRPSPRPIEAKQVAVSPARRPMRPVIPIGLGLLVAAALIAILNYNQTKREATAYGSQRESTTYPKVRIDGAPEHPSRRLSRTSSLRVSQKKQVQAPISLNGATLLEWKNAARADKLQTAKDWLAGSLWKNHLTKPSDFQAVESKARILAEGVDQVAKDVVDSKALSSFKVNEIAASLLTISNDLGPSD